MKSVKVLDLKPTQFSLGFLEVDEKIDKIKKMKKEELQKYLEEKLIPVIIGPNNNLFMIDRHHLARCCWELNIEKVFINEIANLSHLSEEEFWKVLITAKWCHLYDQFGNGPHNHELLPENIRSMSDDPYRSLAWFLKEDKVFSKNGNNVPFIEFYWANFLRNKIKYEHGKDGIKKMIKLAKEVIKKDPEVNKLPGFSKTI